MNGAMSVTKAAWGLMRDQGYGRVINTSSLAGLFGNFGQANYSAAKAALHGFTLSIAKEGEKKNIRVNTICPMAASRLTQGAFPPHIFEVLKPEFVVPLGTTKFLIPSWLLVPRFMPGDRISVRDRSGLDQQAKMAA
jgi:NAD(P)-dependent dehydrogenase (short-subunit alcohol dehydrogenase family)